MSDSNRGEKPFDPFEAWRGMRTASLDAWAKAMVQTVNTDAYAESSGVMLETYLTALAPFKEFLEKTMLQVLQQLNMPSRMDFSSIAERMTNIEMRLDDLDVKLDGMAHQVNMAPRLDKLAVKLDRIEAHIAGAAAAHPAKAAKPERPQRSKGAKKADRLDRKESK
jgi:hypothetical protein